MRRTAVCVSWRTSALGSDRFERAAIAVKDRLLPRRFLPSVDVAIDEVRRELDRAATSAEFLRRHDLRARTGERLEHDRAGGGVDLHRDLEEARGFGRRMKRGDPGFAVPVSFPN